MKHDSPTQKTASASSCYIHASFTESFPLIYNDVRSHRSIHKNFTCTQCTCMCEPNDSCTLQITPAEEVTDIPVKLAPHDTTDVSPASIYGHSICQTASSSAGHVVTPSTMIHTLL